MANLKDGIRRKSRSLTAPLYRVSAVIALTLVFLGAFPRTARAGGTGSFGLGLNLGLAFPNTSSNALAWGLSVIYKTSPLFGLQAFYEKYGVNIDSTSGGTQVSDSTSQSLLGAEGDYYFPGAPGQFHVGAKLGSCSTSVTTSATNAGTTVTGSDSHSNLFLAPLLAYDLPIGAFAAGGEVSYIMGLGNEAPSTILLVATLKFFF